MLHQPGQSDELASRHDALAGPPSGSYSLGVAAKVGARVQQLVDGAAQLPPDELAVLLEAIRGLSAREETVPGRHGVIAERVARVHAGAATLSVEEVERSLRDDLDF